MSAANSSIAELYSQHHGWLLAWLRKKLGCAHHAADVAQDTFLRVLVARDVVAGLREPRAFLTTTAQHLLIDQARRRALETTYLAELALLSESLAAFPSPEQTLETLQTLELIAGALAKASPKAREAFLLHYLEGLGQEDVARRLAVSARMVRKYLVQCLLLCDEQAHNESAP